LTSVEIASRIFCFPCPLKSQRNFLTVDLLGSFAPHLAGAQNRLCVNVSERVGTLPFARAEPTRETWHSAPQPMPEQREGFRRPALGAVKLTA
jgi:hypothetical protein